MYKKAIEVDLSPDEFWNMSAGEAEQIISAKLKRRYEDSKQRMALVWKLGALCSYSFNDPKKYPPLHEAFPGVFNEEPKQTDWRIIKARMAEYSEAKKAGEKAWQKRRLKNFGFS